MVELGGDVGEVLGGVDGEVAVLAEVLSQQRALVKSLGNHPQLRQALFVKLLVSQFTVS